MLSTAQANQIRKIADQRARHAIKAAPPRKPWRAKKVCVRLELDSLGEWQLDLGSGHLMTATDAEVALWKALQEAYVTIAKLRAAGKEQKK